jgi:hypothetical protein
MPSSGGKKVKGVPHTVAKYCMVTPTICGYPEWLNSFEPTGTKNLGVATKLFVMPAHKQFPTIYTLHIMITKFAQSHSIFQHHEVFSVHILEIFRQKT